MPLFSSVSPVRAASQPESLTARVAIATYWRARGRCGHVGSNAVLNAVYHG
eukprot:COSAG02_NODE_30400_length_552_cov_0.412804_1_plen_50_part_01